MNVSLTKNTQTNENKTNFNNNEKHIANTIQNNNKIKKHSKQHKTNMNKCKLNQKHTNQPNQKKKTYGKHYRTTQNELHLLGISGSIKKKI